ncbi:MAG: RecQ family ATP-dependent DNA helicase [Bacteroidota bacterium]|nr:RecQ family ATP-dependent DNA helicase [Bacteroidota bacterium]
MPRQVAGRPSDEELRAVLRTVFGLSDYRPGQREIIHSVLAGEDVLAVMPTGWGKSLCYQLPAVVLPGMAVVVSPLIALMEDQVAALRQRRIPATCLHSGLPDTLVLQRLEECSRGSHKLLYVTPERLQQESFLYRLRGGCLAFVAVDEAHCISEWGHDFRPAYLQITVALQRLGRPPVLALTATATPEVQRDIVEQLRLRSPRVFVFGFDRPNLTWVVEQPEAKRERLAELCADHASVPVIVYAASRHRVDRLSDFLQRRGLRAAAYHAGLNAEVRQRVQTSFLQGYTSLLVATSAFGLGIDKPDVRAVIHYDPPLTLEAYYQEAGRAGRDGEPAECILLYSPTDCTIQQRLIAAAHPNWETVVRVYHMLRQLTQGESLLPLTPVEMANRLRTSETTVEAILRLLELAGILQTTMPVGELMVQWTASRQELMEYWQRNRVPERQRVVEALVRGAGAEAYSRPVVLAVPELLRRYALSADELERGLRSLVYAGLIRCETLRLQPGIYLAQPLPEQPPVQPDLLEQRRRRAWRKFHVMLEYATTQTCKRLFLLQYFRDFSLQEPCGRCSNCTRKGASVLSRIFPVRKLVTARESPARKGVAPIDGSRQRVAELAQRGVSLTLISQQTGLPVATVARLLQEAIERGWELPRQALVPDDRFYTAVRIAVQRLGVVPLREVAAALGGVSDYPALRIAVAFARRELARTGKPFDD